MNLSSKEPPLKEFQLTENRKNTMSNKNMASHGGSAIISLELTCVVETPKERISSDIMRERKLIHNDQRQRAAVENYLVVDRSKTTISALLTS